MADAEHDPDAAHVAGMFPRVAERHTAVLLENIRRLRGRRAADECRRLSGVGSRQNEHEHSTTPESDSCVSLVRTDCFFLANTSLKSLGEPVDDLCQSGGPDRIRLLPVLCTELLHFEFCSRLLPDDPVPH